MGASPTSTETATDAFLADLVERESEPLLAHASGTIRIDLVDGDHVDHRMITIEDGRVAVSRRRGRADVTIELRPETFEGMVTGRVNAIAAVLRGEVVASGDLGLLVRFQRVFPSPPPGGGSPEATDGGSTP